MYDFCVQKYSLDTNILNANFNVYSKSLLLLKPCSSFIARLPYLEFCTHVLAELIRAFEIFSFYDFKNKEVFNITSFVKLLEPKANEFIEELLR